MIFLLSFFSFTLSLLHNSFSSDLLDVSKSFHHLLIHNTQVWSSLSLAVLEAESQLNPVMLTDELEELVLNIDASPQVPVVLQLRLVLIPKSNPAEHIFETAVGLLDGYEALQQSLL